MSSLIESAMENRNLYEAAELVPLEEDTCAQPRARPSMFGRKAALGIFAGLCLAAFALASSAARNPGRNASTAPTDMQDFTSFYSLLGITDSDQIKVKPFSQVLNQSAPGIPKELIRNLQLITEQRKTSKRSVRALNTATCAIDITHATLFLQRAGLAITAATASCGGVSGKSPHVQAACAADVSAVFASLFFVAEYVSEAVLFCAQTIKMPARCSSGISGIVANVGRLATSSAFMAGNCGGAIGFDAPVSASIWQMSRRLEGEGAGEAAAAAVPPPNPNAIAASYNQVTLGTYTCFLDATQATTYLADFGVYIDGATKACSRYSKLNLNNPINRKAHNVYCAMNILDIVEALYMATAYMASAVSHCTPTTNQQALCASGVAGLTGGMAGLSKSILNVYHTCDRNFKGKLDPTWRAQEQVTAWNDYNGPK